MRSERIPVVKTDKIAIIFPGMGYHSDKPLLYYAKRLAREHGYELLEVSYVFNKRARDVMNDDDAKREAFKYAVDETARQLDQVEFAAYQDVLFIGKSIGTAVAAYYDKKNGINARHIVFTPVPETFAHLRNGSGIVFHGTADPWCENELTKAKCEELGLRLYEIEDANHSLETGDALTDIKRMPEILELITKMINDPRGRSQWFIFP